MKLEENINYNDMHIILLIDMIIYIIYWRCAVEHATLLSYFIFFKYDQNERIDIREYIMCQLMHI